MARRSLTKEAIRELFVGLVVFESEQLSHSVELTNILAIMDDQGIEQLAEFVKTRNFT